MRPTSFIGKDTCKNYVRYVHGGIKVLSNDFYVNVGSMRCKFVQISLFHYISFHLILLKKSK